MAWHKIAVLGLLACGIAAGCTVTSDDGDGDTDGGEGDGGSDGSGGSNAGGRNSGGSNAGGSNSGGSSAGGTGAGGAAPNDCNPAGENDCQACVLTKCCTEYFDCNDDTCAGSDTAEGELGCFQECMADIAQDAGTLDSDDVQQCSGQCADVGSTPGLNTQDIITCILAGGDTPDGGTDGCDVECYGVDIALTP